MNEFNREDEIVTSEIVTSEIESNETASKETVLNETISNETVTCETISNETIPNEAIPNETISNETISNNIPVGNTNGDMQNDVEATNTGNISSIENENSNYVFWAEEATAQEATTQQPHYEPATYSYKSSDLGEESRYNSRENKETAYKSENAASNYGTSYASGASSAGGDGKKKKTGFGKKIGKTVAVAAVFGLVAGVVFQGVNRTADIIFPQQKVTETLTQAQVTSTVNTQGTSNSTDLTALVENTMPSIVSITSTVSQDYSYFGQVYSQEYDGSGSGIIVAQNEKEILIATNNHVVEGAKAIAVNFINNKVYEAKIKGTDSNADLAVLSVDISKMGKETLDAIKVATLGSSEDIKVGQMAIAIGNALGSGQSVTVGYISAKNRQVNTSSTSQGSKLELLQTDAAINPGNSGGALLNINGEVIGINDMKYADTDVEGMGYAIPISEAIPIINELMNREILQDDEKGYLGITGSNILKENNPYEMPIGVYISDVAANGAAESGGIKKGDIITKINKTDTKTIEEVQEKVNNTRAGTEVVVTIMRSEAGEYEEIEVTVKLKNSKSLESLQKNEDSGTQGNFGFKSDQGQTDQGQTDQGQTDQGQTDQEQSEQDTNDMLQDFFNQFN